MGGISKIISGERLSGPKRNTLEGEVQQSGSGREQVWLGFIGMAFVKYNLCYKSRKLVNSPNSPIHFCVRPF